MPEEAIINEGQNQITYNVVLDPGDISRQAEEIRNQLDIALGVGSNAGAQFINTTDVVNPQFAPLPPPDFAGMQGQFGETVNQTFWQRAQEQVSNAYQNLSVGVSRIRQDVSMAVDRGGNFIQQFQPEPEPYNPYDELLPDSFGEYLMGSLGFGGDIKGPIPLSSYQKYSRVKMDEGIQDFFQNPGQAYGEFTSTPVGMLANLAGYAVAPGAMLAVDLGMMGDEWLSAAYNKREDLAGGVQEIARQQFGNISKPEARGIAQNVVNFVESYQGYAQEYDLDEVSQNLLQFGNMGGFSNVQNTEQLQSKMQTVVEDTRQIARNLGVFQEEAINIMAELEQKSMVSVEQMRDMSERMRFYGGVLKQSPTELLQGAVTTAEQFRQAGSYLTPDTAMQTYIDANVEAQRLIMSNDPYMQSAAYRMGGQSGVAQGLLGAYSAFQNSTLGGLINMNQWANPGGSGNITDMTNGLAGGFQDINDISLYYGRGQEDVTKNKGLRESMYQFVESAASTYALLNNGEVPSFAHLEGFIQLPGNEQLFGHMSKDEIRMALETVRQDMLAFQQGKDPRQRMRSGEIVSALRSAQENTETTMWGEATAFIKALNDPAEKLSYEWGETKERKADWIKGAVNTFDTWVAETLFGEGNYTADSFIFDPEYTIDAYGNTSGSLVPGGSVVTKFETQFLRDQVSAGRDSGFGRRVADRRTAELETEAMDTLRKRGIKITETEDLSKYEDVLKAQGLDSKTRKARVDILFGQDNFITDDQRFAIEMWQGNEINNPMAESYYKNEIETILQTNPGLFQDDKGEFLSLEGIITKLDETTLEDSPYKNLSAEDRKRLQFQAADRIQDTKFEDKMVNEKEAKRLGKESYARLLSASMDRQDEFAKEMKNLDTAIGEGQTTLMSTYSKGEVTSWNLGKDTRTALDVAVNSALSELKSFQGSPEESQARFFARVEEIYDDTRDGKGRDFQKGGLDELIKRTFAEGPGREYLQKYTGLTSDRSTAAAINETYKVIDKEFGEIMKAGNFGMSTTEVATAMYDIFPGYLASGKMDVSNMSAEGFKDFTSLLGQIKKGDENIDFKAYAEKLIPFFKDMSKEQLEKDFKEKAGQQNALDDKDVPSNTQKIRENTSDLVMLFRNTMNYGQLDKYYKEKGIEPPED